MGNCCATQDEFNAQEGLNDSQPVASEELPPGWKMVPSRSRPGKVSYQNIHTGERISWVPKEEAKTYKGGITKNKKKKKKKRTNETSDNTAMADDVSLVTEQKDGSGVSKTVNGTTLGKTGSDATALNVT